MKFKHYDSLRFFTQVAQSGSFSTAADALSLTKGAISHQVRSLESVLGFALFHRQPRGVVLTEKGEVLHTACCTGFDAIERVIASLQSPETPQLTLGTTTYFASRWLSQRLMKFMQQHADVRLRMQPMVDLSDLDGEGIDVAIRWGNGEWNDLKSERLFACPAWPCGDKAALASVKKNGLKQAFSQFTLLHDRQQSKAWHQWFLLAGMDFPEREGKLIIPDPNVRVEAVTDGQGVALNDALVEREIRDKRLYRLSEIELSDYGYYLVYSTASESSELAAAFAHWILSETSAGQTTARP